MINRTAIGSEQIIDEEVARVESFPDKFRVVDMGGAIKPLYRANWVVDRLPCDLSTPGRGHVPIRYSYGTWISQDLCEHTGFSADSFEYSFCSQVVEDVRDPIGLVSELSRISKRGFISTVYWKYELSTFEGEWAGYWHHRWLVHPHNGVLEFVYKPPFLYSPIVEIPLNGKLLHVWWSDSVEAQEVFYEGDNTRQGFIDFFSNRWDK